jgi:hypothetical protein
MSIIRRTVRARYALLPFWYTLFYEAELTGELVIHVLVLCIRLVDKLENYNFALILLLDDTS